MEFRSLGPVEVTAGGRTYAPGRPMHRALLGLLLLDAGQVVAVDRLVDQLWPGGAPGGAVALVHTYASRLRRDLTGGAEPPANRLVTRRPGYVLMAAASELDVARFEEWARAARASAAAGDHGGAARTAAAALDLWRGRPYADVPPVPALVAEADRLEEARLTTLELRLAAELDCGRDAELVGDLAALVDAHPLRERLCRLLVTALARSGRQAEALAAYRAARDRLVAEVGVEPGPELRQAHAAVLAGSSGPGAAAGSTGVGSGRGRGPAQLPPDVADFRGRSGALAEVSRELARPGPAVPVVAVSGPAGVGKTALAVHAAHRLRDRYPDGQLAVSLRGAVRPPADPAEVLGRFLRALGVEGAAVPAELDERVESYRTLVADRRLLVLLDDAAGEAQVRPLLPGGAGCGVLVTSRARLAGLAGARTVDLDLPAQDEALDLLAAVAGPERVRAEPAAAERVVRSCGRLPLAVRIAGAKLAAAPHTTVARLAGQLADERRRMDHLVAGDLDLRAGFRLSYDQLTEPARRAFRRLGLLGLAEFDGWVVAALLDVPPEDDAALRELLAARLVDAAAPVAGADRHRVHDLLRAYAVELAADEPERGAALDRVLAGWLTLAEAADEALPYGLRPAHRSPAARRPLPADGVRADPGGWFGAERPALLAAVELAAREGRDDTAWALAAATGGLLDLHQGWADWHRVAELGLAAATRAGDRGGEVELLIQLGACDMGQGRFPEARSRLEAALTVATTAGDRDGTAHALLVLAAVHRVLGDLDAGLDRARGAAAGFAELGDRRGETYAQVMVGTCEARKGRLAEGIASLHAANDRLAAAGDRHGESQASAYLASALREAGDLPGAVAALTRTRRLCAELGDLVGGTVAQRELAACHTATGRPEQAVPLLEEAAGQLARLGHRLGEAFLLLDLGAARRAAGRPAAAADDLRRAAERFGQVGLPQRQAAALALLGETEADLGDEPTARARAAAALDLDPGCTAAQALRRRLTAAAAG